jgi:hypothetical protein
MGVTDVYHEALTLISSGTKPKKLFTNSYVIQDPNFSIHVGIIEESNVYYMSRNEIGLNVKEPVLFRSDNPDKNDVIRLLYEKIKTICYG